MTVAQRVAGVVESQLRRGITPAAGQWQRDARVEDQAFAFLQGGVGEVDIFTGEAGVNATPLPAAVEHDLRQALVRRGDRCGRILQGLVFLRAQQPAAPARIPGQVGVLQQVGVVGHAEAAGTEVAEVAVVAGPVVVDAQSDGRAQALAVLERHIVATAIVFAVVDALQHQRAVVIRVQVAVFAAQHQAAAGDHAWRDRGVAVGGDVPVVRQGEIKSVAAFHAECRRQQAGLASSVEREIEIRCPHQRYALELEHAGTGLAHAGQIVESDVAGTDVPVVATRFAGGEAALLDAVELVAQHFDLAAFGPQGAGLAGHVRVVDDAAFGIDQVIKVTADQLVAIGAQQGGTRPGQYPVLCLEVIQPVRFHGLVPARDHHFAFGTQGVSDDARHLVGGQHRFRCRSGAGCGYDR